MSCRKFLYFIIIFYPNLIVSAQELNLVLDRRGYKRDIRFSEGDEIVFRTKWEKFNRSDNITGFNDSSIFFDSYEVAVADIAFIRTEHIHGFLSPSNGPKLIIAGLILPAFDFYNYSVLQRKSPTLDRGILVVSGALAATGIFLTSLRYSKFRPGLNRVIRIIP